MELPQHIDTFEVWTVAPSCGEFLKWGLQNHPNLAFACICYLGNQWSWGIQTLRNHNFADSVDSNLNAAFCSIVSRSVSYLSEVCLGSFKSGVAIEASCQITNVTNIIQHAHIIYYIVNHNNIRYSGGLDLVLSQSDWHIETVKQCSKVIQSHHRATGSGNNTHMAAYLSLVSVALIPKWQFRLHSLAY